MLSPNVDGRLIIVSNRLPVTISQASNGEYKCSPSSGGLVTGLGGLSKCGVDFLWYGWPGVEIPVRNLSHMRDRLFREHSAVPVLLDSQLANNYYDGFSSECLNLTFRPQCLKVLIADSTLWPLFHHQHNLVEFNDDTADAYRKANKAFADTIAAEMQDGDLIWVHDYHLMLLPQMLRERADKFNINIRIGWFLHTPFPEQAVFRLLPSATEILEGIIGADIVGFQTKEARSNFFSSTYKLLYAHLLSYALVGCWS
jgi:trehalose 6-phosphate synthase